MILQCCSKKEMIEDFQEAGRKDMDHAFGVLQGRWHIVNDPVHMWNPRDLGKIMKTCIILHNMIIESDIKQGINHESFQPHRDEMVDDVHLEHDLYFSYI
ncbi:hypothetical protein Dsin_028535 [Dipteronia sinensis]|uniref:DDE Tnp4 domain-containing protein n=1 Tax=Dipteronia sinensis TaxID=43782 RepID=A0AAD9ZR11_9ROSI|nr:hypothetical protein Dsin_028535 [Dipteronia sinensis]